MKKFVIIFVLFFAAISFSLTGSSGADFFDKNEIGGSTFAATCWVAPSAVSLLAPTDVTATNAADVAFSWSPTTSTCPIASLAYKLEVASTSDFASPILTTVYNSGTSSVFTGIPTGSFFWRVIADDGYGNISTSSAFQLTVDRTPPIISGISHVVTNPTSTTDALATISWNTDEPTTSNLEFSTVSGGSYTALSSDLTADNTSHSRVINSLLADTTYYFRVRSTDTAGNESVSLEDSFNSGNVGTSLPTVTDIVINEYLPNPTGADDALMTGGEWAEIYNRGSINYDLSGWYLTDADTGHKLYLTTTNTTSSNPATTGLTIAPGEFMVVYRNGDVSFDLDNGPTGDEIRLYRTGNWFVDIDTYTSAPLENKSYARFPDGSNTWFDPIPTPLGPNVLEASATIIVADDKKTVSFKVEHIEGYKTLDYSLAYDTYSVTKGVSADNIDIVGLTTYDKNGIDLATCSDVCTYDQDVKNFILHITLKKSDGTEVTLSATK
jgi:hypothetical protein